LRRRFFPVGPVVLSKVTVSTRTGGVIGTLSRSVADSLGGTACVGRGTSSSSSLRMSAGHIVLQSGMSARGCGWLLPSRGESARTLGLSGRMGVGGSELVSGEFPGVGSGVCAGVGSGVGAGVFTRVGSGVGSTIWDIVVINCSRALLWLLDWGMSGERGSRFCSAWAMSRRLAKIMSVDELLGITTFVGNHVTVSHTRTSRISQIQIR
jgi:hypothetical protein